MAILLAGFIWTAPAAQADAESSQAAIEQLVRDAYANSPELRAAYARWQSAFERIPQAESLPDPTVVYGYFVERMDTRQIFRVEQMFPGFGKRGLRGEVAGEAAAAAADGLEAAAADVRKQVIQASASYILARRAVTLMEDNLDLLEQLERVARQRYRIGEASQADVLRLESERESLQIELQSWQEREPALRARVNAVVGRAADRPLPEMNELPPLPDPSGLRSESLDQRIARNPDLRAGEARIRQAERSRELAQRESRSDFMVGLEYMDNRGMAADEVMAMVSVSIPLWRGRYRALREERAADLRAAEADYQASYNRIEADAQMALYEVEDAVRRVNLFADGLLPRAQQTLSIVEQDYRTGNASFLDLLGAQRSLLDLELEWLRARTDAVLRAAEWERLTEAGAKSGNWIQSAGERR